MSFSFKVAAAILVSIAITASASIRGEHETAKKVDAALKEALEEQFGPLKSETYEKKQFYGTVAGVNYTLKDGRLEDGWTRKVVTALGKVGVEARDEDSEVRAEDQSIDDQKFLSLQVTSSRGIDENDSLGIVLMLSP